MSTSHKLTVSAVLNTLNNEKEIERAIKSVAWADEILICDMESDDRTVDVAKRLGVKVISHKRLDFVEPARNFAISKASSDWILILDPDEEVPDSLKNRLMQIVEHTKEISYIKIPRKNIIFNKWTKASMWWPDYNIRFFKKGAVRWTNKIHRPPEVSGEGLDLPAEESFAIIHHHYDSTMQFLERMIRYTKIQARELVDDGYKFDWQDLIKKPLGEFLGRFFANKGYQDGVHGFVLSLLQAFSFLIVYIRVWELEGFKEKEMDIKELNSLSNESGDQIKYWFINSSLSKNSFKRFFQKVGNKL